MTATIPINIDSKTMWKLTTTTTVYLSGKITGMPELNRPLFDFAHRLIRSLGAGVIYNPHHFCIKIPVGSRWKTYMKRCIKKLADSDVVVVLPDWHWSRGATYEVALSVWLGIPVIRLSTMRQIPTWKLLLLIAKFYITYPFYYVIKNS